MHDIIDDVDDEQPIVAALLTILLIIDVGNVDNDDKLQACILPHIDRLLYKFEFGDDEPVTALHTMADVAFGPSLLMSLHCEDQFDVECISCCCINWLSEYVGKLLDDCIPIDNEVVV